MRNMALTTMIHCYPPIARNYLDQNIPVIERRLSAAGMRLAALLNVIFDETKELPTGLSKPLKGE